MKQWLQQHREPVRDDDLAHIAAWLDGRLNARDSARVEMLLAADAELLTMALALREATAEPVSAVDLMTAQALVTGLPVSAWRWQSWRTKLLVVWHDLQPIPLAFGATVTVLVAACSLWLGSVAALEFGVEDLQTASMLEITQLDFGAGTVAGLSE